MWREKMIKISWWVLALNLSICVFNLVNGYVHFAKHNYGMMTFSLVLVAINGFVVWSQYKTVLRFKQELKDLTWELLQKPSEQLS